MREGDPVRLRLDRGGDLRVGMAQTRDRRAPRSVEIALAVCVDDVGPVAVMRDGRSALGVTGKDMRHGEVSLNVLSLNQTARLLTSHETDGTLNVQLRRVMPVPAGRLRAASDKRVTASDRRRVYLSGGITRAPSGSVARDVVADKTDSAHAVQGHSEKKAAA